MGQEQLYIVQEMKRGEDDARIKHKIWREEGSMLRNREMCKRVRGTAGKVQFSTWLPVLGADCFHAVRPWHLALEFIRT